MPPALPTVSRSVLPHRRPSPSPPDPTAHIHSRPHTAPLALGSGSACHTTSTPPGIRRRACRPAHAIPARRPRPSPPQRDAIPARRPRPSPPQPSRPHLPPPPPTPTIASKNIAHEIRRPTPAHRAHLPRALAAPALATNSTGAPPRPLIRTTRLHLLVAKRARHHPTSWQAVAINL
jgi:hypothetical protein